MATQAETEAVNPETAEPAKKDKGPSLHITRFKTAEYERSVWVVTPEIGVTPEDLLKPSFWAHVAIQMRPFDKVEVRADDGSYYGEMLVLLTGRTWAKVTPLFFKELEQTEADAADVEDMFVKFSGPKAKWRIIRTKDKMVLSEGHATRDLANSWMHNHRKQMAH